MRTTHNLYKHYALELSLGKNDIVFCRRCLTESPGDKRRNIMKKIAVVTGASRGIGRAVAKRLAQDGFAVVVNYLSNASEAEEVVAEIKVIGGEAITVKADVANQTDVERLFEETMKKFGS